VELNYTVLIVYGIFVSGFSGILLTVWLTYKPEICPSCKKGHVFGPRKWQRPSNYTIWNEWYCNHCGWTESETGRAFRLKVKSEG
jgi:hypothetical protein